MKLSDYNIYYKKCDRCGYDTGKSTKPRGNRKRCWKCGNFIDRDFSKRALK